MLTGADVQVSDTLLPDDLKGALIEAVNWMPMYFLNRWERFRSHELDMHWQYPVAFGENDSIDDDVEPQLAALDEALRPIDRCWQAIKAMYPYPVKLYECALSANAFGTEGRVHQDVEEDRRASHRTALVFCNREWRVDWAGETLVIDAEGEISAAVLPKPGRVIRIQGDPQHVGRSVSRTCPTDRRVLVYKFWGDAAQ